ncbi:MAG TPA: hypothetical protein VN798_21300 [Pseudomonas sp.]|nr:hypothetical protein [Pseudomonas sp.]
MQFDPLQEPVELEIRAGHILYRLIMATPSVRTITASARRAWEAGLPTIRRAPAANPATAVSGLAAASRQIVSKLDSYGLRPESKAELQTL